MVQRATSVFTIKSPAAVRKKKNPLLCSAPAKGLQECAKGVNALLGSSSRRCGRRDSEDEQPLVCSSLTNPLKNMK